MSQNNEIPDNLGYVFVLTYGRSGSTLLMKILNSIEGYDIRGENHNALFHLFRTVDALRKSVTQPGGDAANPGNPWYGAPDIEADTFAARCVREFSRAVLRPGAGTRVTGFKEIRHTISQMTEAEFLAYVAFILAEFPDARIIFNTRNAQDVASSDWFKNMPRETVVEKIQTSDAWFAAAATQYERCFAIDYADVSSGAARVKEMFAFLGEPYDGEMVRSVLAVPLTHAKKAKPKSRLAKLWSKR